MPLGVTMQQLHTGVIRSEPNRGRTVRIHNDGIPPHRDLGEVKIVGEVRREQLFVVGPARDELELVAVEMERVRPGVVVVDGDFDDGVVREDVRVRGHGGVDLGVEGEVGGGGREGGV